MKKKEPKKKPYRSIVSNAFWSYGGMWKEAPVSLVLMVLEVPLNVFLAYAGIYLPSLVVAEVTGKESLQHAFLRVGILILCMFIAETAKDFSNLVSRSYIQIYKVKKEVDVCGKSMRLFYQTYEKKEIRDLSSRAVRATQMWDGADPIPDMPERSLKIVEYILCYCLFGTVLSFVSPWLVLFLTLAPLVNWFCARIYHSWEYKNRENISDLDRKIWYLLGKTADFGAAKDIRIYGMAEWFRRVYGDLGKAKGGWEKRMTRRLFCSRIPDLFVILLRDGAAYAVLIAMVLRGEIPVDRFVLYFSAVSMFAACVGNIVNEWNRLQASSLLICDYREYLDLEEEDGSGEAHAADHMGAAPEITFEHVSFRHDGAKEDTLKDVSFTMKAGEKVALVGLNGAGKTTLVKLLCGLYQPSSGDIRINGVSVRKFLREDYYGLFSPVFQDITTGFFSLAETVSGQIGEGMDEERATQCMIRAGLGKKLASLPQGIHTKLDKQVNENGVELSGGELQKLILARALYKDAPILVLDEPTAALDPIAENEIYQQYGSMTEGKTSLFISHRLASTQFCDRIIYLKEGCIAEEGTHGELIRLGGEYSQLYEMQSCWYREDYKGGAEE